MVKMFSIQHDGKKRILLGYDQKSTGSGLRCCSFIAADHDLGRSQARQRMIMFLNDGD